MVAEFVQEVEPEVRRAEPDPPFSAVVFAAGRLFLPILVGLPGFSHNGAETDPLPPELFLPDEAGAIAIVDGIFRKRQDLVAEVVGGADRIERRAVVGEDLADGAAELDEADGVRHPFRPLRLPPEDRHGRGDAGADEPGLVDALEDGHDLELVEDPRLETEAVLDVEPLAGGEQAEPAVLLQEACRVGPEVAVDVAPAGQAEPRPPPGRV